jgi:hypothetical protein
MIDRVASLYFTHNRAMTGEDEPDPLRSEAAPPRPVALVKDPAPEVQDDPVPVDAVAAVAVAPIAEPVEDEIEVEPAPVPVAPLTPGVDEAGPRSLRAVSF